MIRSLPHSHALPPGSCTLTCMIDGLTDARHHVQSFSGSEGLSLLPSYELDIAFDARPKDLTAILSRPATVKAVFGPGFPGRAWHGQVQRIRALGYKRSRHLYRITIVPWPPKGALHRRFRVFQDQTARQIAEKLLDDHGVSSAVRHWQIAADTKPHALRLQYGETDWAFLCRILAADGIAFSLATVTDESGTPSIRWLFCDGSSPDPVLPHLADLLFAPDQAPAEAAFYRVSRFTPDYREHRSVIQVSDYDPSAPNIALVGQFGQPTSHYDAHPLAGFVEREDGERLAGQMVAADLAESRFVECETNYPHLMIGHRFGLASRDIAFADLNHTHWLPSALTFRMQQPTGNRGGLDYQCQFRAVPADTSGRAWVPVRIPPPLVTGALLGQVVDQDGQTGNGRTVDTDTEGRVNVRLLWQPSGPDAPPTFARLRVMTQMAGEGFGTVFTPRVGTEVVIQFINGDPDRPFIAGSLYNSSTPPPLLDKDFYNQGIVSSAPTTGMGHRFGMSDDKDNPAVTLESYGSMSFGSQKLMSLAATQNIRISASTTMDIESTNDMKIESSDNIKLFSNASLKQDAKTIALSSIDRLEISSKGPISTTADKEIKLTARNGYSADVERSDWIVTIQKGAASLKALDGDIDITSTKNVRINGKKIEQSSQTKKTASSLTKEDKLINSLSDIAFKEEFGGMKFGSFGYSNEFNANKSEKSARKTTSIYYQMQNIGTNITSEDLSSRSCNLMLFL